MGFSFKKWHKARVQQEIIDMYGENGSIMLRDKKYTDTNPKSHHFAHLLNKVYIVPVYEFRPFFNSEPEQRSYLLSESAKLQNALRMAAMSKTSFDN